MPGGRGRGPPCCPLCGLAQFPSPTCSPPLPPSATSPAAPGSGNSAALGPLHTLPPLQGRACLEQIFIPAAPQRGLPRASHLHSSASWAQASTPWSRWIFLQHQHVTSLHAKSLQSCRPLCDPLDYSPPGSSVQGIPQARIREWVAISFSRGSS